MATGPAQLLFCALTALHLLTLWNAQASAAQLAAAAVPTLAALGTTAAAAGGTAATGGGWVGRQVQAAAHAGSKRALAAASSGGGQAGASGAPATKQPCRPAVRAVAQEQPQLRQALALADAGYDMFAVDGHKPFTVLAPSDAALQRLAAGIVDQDERLALQEGFYAVVLYHQLPEGAMNVSQLIAAQTDEDNGVLTLLGKAMRKKFSVTFDDTTHPVVATGGWPANNAPILSSHKACNGWLHVIDAVLLPTQQIRDLPRLVDDVPDLSMDSFWGLLDGSFTPTSSGASADAPAPDAGDFAGPPPAHSNNTGVVVSGGNGTEDASSGSSDAPSSASGGGGSDRVLVIAASVAAGAVVLCCALVGGVLLRKRQLRRRRQQHHHVEQQQDEDEERFQVSMSKGSMRAVQVVHVDA